MAPKRLVFLGPPGTGKGTQAARLRELHGWHPLSSGDVMRAEIKAQSAIGKAAADYVKSGKLVPDGIITSVILAGLERLPHQDGWILDGFPRTVPQAEALETGLQDWKTPIDGVINFDLADRTIVERIISRRVCKVCGSTYNVRFQPPRQEGVCDRCGGEVTQRVDDREDVVATRLATYREQTAPLIAFYQQRGLLHTVSAADAVDQVAQAIAIVLASLGGAA